MGLILELTTYGAVFYYKGFMSTVLFILAGIALSFFIRDDKINVPITIVAAIAYCMMK